MQYITIPYLAPFDYEGLYKSYLNHRIGNLEWFQDQRMIRVFCYERKVGKIEIVNDSVNSELVVAIDFPDSSANDYIYKKVRSLFDLDSDPVVIDKYLSASTDIKKLLSFHPGIRIPSGWEPFEIAIMTILGQLVSMENCCKLVHDLIELYGEDSGIQIDGKNIKLFPSPQKIFEVDLSDLKTTRIRKQTLKNFSEAVLNGTLSLDSEQDAEKFIDVALSIKGIGPWTAHYMALKVLRNTDSFPASDLILARTLEFHSKDVIDSMSPWRGYVAALFWRIYSEKLTKKKINKALRPAVR